MTHKINHGWCPDRTDPQWAERVEREAIRHTAARQAQYERATRRLARAEQRLERVRARTKPNITTRALAVAQELVELRRQELLTLQRMMTRSPSSATHRGRKSYRPVPDPHAM